MQDKYSPHSCPSGSSLKHLMVCYVIPRETWQSASYMLNGVKLQNASRILLQLLCSYPLILKRSDLCETWTHNTRKKKFLIGIAVSRALAKQELSHQPPPWEVKRQELGEGDGKHHHHPLPQNRNRSILIIFSLRILSLRIPLSPVKRDISLITALSVFIFVVTLLVKLWTTLNN